MNFLIKITTKLINNWIRLIEESKYGPIFDAIIGPVIIILIIYFIIHQVNKFYKNRKGQKHILKNYFKEIGNNFKETMQDLWEENRGGVIFVVVIFTIILILIIGSSL
jgi:5-methylthioribose kinase